MFFPRTSGDEANLRFHNRRKDRHGARARAVFFGAEIAARQGIETEGGEKFRGDHVCVQALRLA